MVCSLTRQRSSFAFGTENVGQHVKHRNAASSSAADERVARTPSPSGRQPSRTCQAGPDRHRGVGHRGAGGEEAPQPRPQPSGAGEVPQALPQPQGRLERVGGGPAEAVLRQGPQGPGRLKVDFPSDWTFLCHIFSKFLLCSRLAKGRNFGAEIGPLPEEKRTEDHHIFS